MSLEKPAGIAQNKENIITLEEISELEEPIKKIITQLRTRIEKGEYGLIIGDDVSGRIPGLVVGGFIKKISQLKGFHKPDIVFIPGKLDKDDNLGERLQEYVSKYGVKKGDRILLITEAIRTGESISVLSQTIIASGYMCDIATIGIEELKHPAIEERRTKNLAQANIISGEYSRESKKLFSSRVANTPLVYRKEMSGVAKKYGDLVSQPLIKKLYSWQDSIKIQKEIGKSRMEVGMLVDKLVTWYSCQDTTAKN